MKRTITFILVSVCAVASAQNINDVLRYSQENITGTPRFQAMSGAFGALGGDMSSLNINPAGGAVFTRGQFSVTAGNYHSKNNSDYFGSSHGASKNNFELNQLGSVIVLNSTNPQAKWKKITFAFNYDMMQNFDDGTYIGGRGNQGIDNYFLNFAQGQPLGPILIQQGEYIEDAYLDIGSSLGYGPQQAFLGYYGGIIDPVALEDDNELYTSNASYNTLNQSYSQDSYGYNSKFLINMATQYEDFLYLGAALNFYTSFFDRYTEYSEDGYDNSAALDYANFDNWLRTDGYGFSFTLGGIARLNEVVRAGFSYQSPTWYQMQDETSQRINSNLADSDIGFINYNVVNVFEGYTIKVPGKITGSLGLVFGEHGILSFDYAFQDMSKAELRPTYDGAFATVNDEIQYDLGGISTYRVGGEYRLGPVSLRAGYRYEDSPYRDDTIAGALQGYSAGLGFAFGRSRLDVGFNRYERDMKYWLFDVGMPTPAEIIRVNTQVNVGYSFVF